LPWKRIRLSKDEEVIVRPKFSLPRTVKKSIRVEESSKFGGKLRDPTGGWKRITLTDDYQPVFSARHVTSEESTDSDTYVTVPDSDVLIDPAIFQVYKTLYLRFLAHLKATTGYEAFARLYRQHAAVPITETEISTTNDVYTVCDSGWVDITGLTGLESFQVQLRSSVAGQLVYCNSAIMLLCGVQL